MWDMNGKDLKTPDVRKLSSPELWFFDPALLVRKREDFQNADWRFANGKSWNSSKIVVFSQVSCTSLWLQENSQWPERCQRCQSDHLEKALCCSCGTYLRNKATSSTNPFNLAFSDLVDSLLHPSLAPGALFFPGVLEMFLHLWQMFDI